MRHRVLLSIFSASAIFAVAISFAQQSDVVKERPVEIRKADAPDETPTPSKSASPKKKKKSTPTPTAKPKKHTTPKEDSDEEKPKRSASPHKKKKSASASPNESASPKKKKKKTSPSPSPTKKKSPAKEEETPSPKSSASAPKALAVPSATVVPAARSTTTFALSPTPAEEAEQLTIEKSGYERPRSFWERLFGGGGRSSNSSGAGYRYLSASVRSAIDRVSADRRNPRWQLIVVHNSGTRQGNARVFDYYHKHVRHMQNGLAYHFVIGNGTSTGNGQVEVGDRWRRQINGGHVHSDYLNNIAIGICLVGDFNRDQPTRAQLDCCEELVRYLRQACGKFDRNHFPFVRPHREVNPPRWSTDCPGDRFPYAWFGRFRD